MKTFVPDDEMAHAIELMIAAEEADDGFFHGCHVECQLDRDRPVMACGQESSWLSMKDRTPAPLCPHCWRTPGPYCPVCGVKLKDGGPE